MSIVSNSSVAATLVRARSGAVAVTVADERSRLPLVDALRAFAASTIACHHLASYPPLADGAMPIAGGLLTALHEHGRVAQVFFVVSGFILARGLSHKTWDRGQIGRFVAQRYCRLGLPYLAAAGMAMLACAFARGWVDDRVLGSLPTLPQLVAHSLFLQHILGFESLSAGLWFVCISFQLALLYVVGLFIRDWIAGRAGNPVRARVAMLPMLAGWVLATASLFYFNLDERWDCWAVYFFGQFFLGVLAHHALKSDRSQIAFGCYVVLMAAAVAFDLRWRLVSGLLTGLLLFVGGKFGFATRWPANPIIAFMGKTSYSLFLIHFPVLIVVATLWMRWEWTSPEAATMGLVVTYLASVAASAAFYQYVESPAARLSRRFA